MFISYYKEEFFKEAKSEFLRLLKTDDTSPQALAGLAIISQKEGKSKDANAYIKKLHTYEIDSEGELQIRFRAVQLSSSFRILFESEHYYSDIEKLAEKILKHHPQDIPALFNITIVQCNQGRTEDALLSFQKLLETGEHFNAIQSNKNLDHIRNTPRYKELMKKHFPDEFKTTNE